MRGSSALTKRIRPARTAQRTSGYVCWQCRAIQISASPTTESPRTTGGGTGGGAAAGGGGDAFGPGASATRDPADARFEVLGSSYSLLSVSLSASQKLYTRRGTLVSVAGKVDNAQSTLSLLAPVRRMLLGIPFLYQRISSTTPITALIATRSRSTTFTVLHLDGTTDWMVGQRDALLAWTGHTLLPRPRAQLGLGLSVAHWGNTHLTGRGLAALSAPGQTYRLTLAEGEDLVLHPAHVVAYALGRHPPLPFRLRSNALSLQVPAVPASVTAAAGRLVPAGLARFWAAMRDTDTYKLVARLLFTLRTAARRSIWGDRLFLHFRGPTTILVSSRGVSIADALTRDAVNEIADTEAGVVPRAIELATRPREGNEGADAPGKSVDENLVGIHVASVQKDGKVSFEDPKDLREFVR